MRTALVILASIALLGGCQKGGSGSQSGAGSAGSPLGNLGPKSAATKTPKKPFKLSVAAPSPGKVGQPLVAKITLLPANGYKVNVEYPTKLIVRADGTANPNQTLTAKDAKELSKKRALFAPAVTLSQPGEKVVHAELKFSVCTESVCELKREKLTWRATAAK